MHNSVRWLHHGYVLHRSVEFLTEMTVILEGVGEAPLSVLRSSTMTTLLCYSLICMPISEG